MGLLEAYKLPAPLVVEVHVKSILKASFGGVGVGPPLHGRSKVLPPGVMLPVGVLKPVLDIKEDAHYPRRVLDG